MGKGPFKHKGLSMYIMPDPRGGLDQIVARSPRGGNGAFWGVYSPPHLPPPERRPLAAPVVGARARRATI